MATITGRTSLYNGDAGVLVTIPKFGSRKFFLSYDDLINDDIIDGDADYYKLTSKGKETLEVQIVDYTEEQTLLTTDEFYVSVTEKLWELESILDSTEMSDISKDRIYFILDNCATDIYEELQND